VLVVNIGSDANDAVRRSANRDEFHHGIRPIDMSIDGILIGEHSLSERLTDNNDRFFAAAIRFLTLAI
jgi:hypothetical protein